MASKTKKKSFVFMFRKQIGFALLEHVCSCVCTILLQYKFNDGAHIQQNDISFTRRCLEKFL